MADRMGKLYKEFADFPNVQFVSISVDPDFDTPIVLQEYATIHGVNDNRWLFLRGAIDSVAYLSERDFCWRQIRCRRALKPVRAGRCEGADSRLLRDG